MIDAARYVLKNTFFLAAAFVAAGIVYVSFFMHHDRVDSRSYAETPTVIAVPDTDFSRNVGVVSDDIAPVDLHDVTDLAGARASLEKQDAFDSFSSMIEKSLDVAIKKAVSEIKTPEERLSETMIAISYMGRDRRVTRAHVAQMEEALDELIDSLEMSMWHMHADARTVVAAVMASDRRLVDIRKRIDDGGVAMADSMSTLLLYAALYSAEPHACLKNIRDFRILEQHRLHGTFEHMRRLQILLQSLSAVDRVALKATIETPRLDLWASAYQPAGALEKILGLFHVGGKLCGLPVETNAANVARSNDELERLLKKYSRR